MDKSGNIQNIAIIAGWLVCEYPRIGKTFKGNLALLPEGIYKACTSADHGIKQKFGDAEAADKTGAAKYAVVPEIWDSLLENQWKRTTSGPDLTAIICEAVARIKGLNLADVTKAVEKVAKKDAEAAVEKVKTWGSKAKVKAEILKIRAERASKLVDETDDLDIEV